MTVKKEAVLSILEASEFKTQVNEVKKQEYAQIMKIYRPQIHTLINEAISKGEMFFKIDILKEHVHTVLTHMAGLGYSGIISSSTQGSPITYCFRPAV